MIPIQDTRKVKASFAIFVLLFIFLGAFVFFKWQLSSGFSLDWLLWQPTSIRVLLLPLFHDSWVSLLSSLIYLWVFLPWLFKSRKSWRCLIEAYAISLLTLALYVKLFNVVSPIAGGPCFVGALLGFAMRGDKWGSAWALLPTHRGLLKVEVPHYVLLFF